MPCKHFHGGGASQSPQKQLLLPCTHLGYTYNPATAEHSFCIGTFIPFPDRSVWDPVIQRWIRGSPFPWQAYGLLIVPVSCSHLFLISSPCLVHGTTQRRVCWAEVVWDCESPLPLSSCSHHPLCRVWLRGRNAGSLAEGRGCGQDVYVCVCSAQSQASGSWTRPSHVMQWVKCLGHCTGIRPTNTCCLKRLSDCADTGGTPYALREPAPAA